MRVRLKTTMASPKGVHSAGQTIDLPTHAARDLVAGGFAEPLEAWPDEETASLTPLVETATKRKRK